MTDVATKTGFLGTRLDERSVVTEQQELARAEDIKMYITEALSTLKNNTSPVNIKTIYFIVKVISAEDSGVEVTEEEVEKIYRTMQQDA